MKRLILETPRLRLCEMDFSDLRSLSAILQDESVMYAYDGAFSDEETAMWLEKQIRETDKEIPEKLNGRDPDCNDPFFFQ